MIRTRVGIVGAGQLARMTAQAAIALGVDLRILANSFHESAARVWPDVLLGSPDDPMAIASLAAGCDVTTFDHELVDIELIHRLEREGHRFAPSGAVMAVAQSKRLQSGRFANLGLPVPAFEVAESGAVSVDRVASFGQAHGWPVVIKAERGGYDGRGVWVVDSPAAAADILNGLAARQIDTLFEKWAPIEQEVALLMARSAGGMTAFYPLVETVQQQGMLRELIAPADIDQQLADQALQIADRVAGTLDVVGLLAVEFFVSEGRLLVNEIATRPHNSGHYTIDGSVTSQFEQHLRAILGLPLGATTLTGNHVATVNAVGRDGGLPLEANLQRALAIDGAHVHIYGKEPKAERKLGHVTVVAADRQSALDRARQAASLLEGRDGYE